MFVLSHNFFLKQDRTSADFWLERSNDLGRSRASTPPKKQAGWMGWDGRPFHFVLICCIILLFHTGFTWAVVSGLVPLHHTSFSCPIRLLATVCLTHPMQVCWMSRSRYLVLLLVGCLLRRAAAWDLLEFQLMLERLHRFTVMNLPNSLVAWRMISSI